MSCGKDSPCHISSGAERRSCGRTPMVAFENRAIATAGREKFWRRNVTKTGRLHHHANVPRAGEGDGGGVNASARSSVGTAGCIYLPLPAEAPLMVRSTPLR